MVRPRGPRWGVAAATALLVVAACARPTAPPLSPAARDAARFEEFVARYASGALRDDDNDPAPPSAGVTAAADRRALRHAGEILSSLEQFDTTHLNVQQRIDWLMIRAAERGVVADTVLRKAERDPGRYVTLGSIYWQVVGERAPTPEDWNSALATLEDAPRALAVGRERLADPPDVWVRLALGTAQRFEAFLDGEFLARASGAPDSLRRRLVAAANASRDAIRGYAAFLRDTLRVAPPGSWATGADYYDWLLREVHYLPYTAESMIAEGRRIHEATKRALDSLAAQHGSGRPWLGMVSDMQTRHPEAGRIVEAYRTASHRVQAFLIRDDLIRLPPCQELLFVPTPPAQRETYAWGGYGGLREQDGVLLGRFFVTDVVPEMSPAEASDKLRAQNYGWVSVIALHEGYPGHHLQRVYARLSPRPLRRRMSNTYFGEGWALYAEHWMRRVGLFTTPDQRLAQLQMRLWRTARVIVDPSLHTGRMTYEQAVRFMMDEVGLTRSAAEAEVNRYTTWPTQAPSYIIGWLEIEKLKAELQGELGQQFSEKRFHEVLLEQGSLPLALMRRAVRDAMLGAVKQR